MMDLAINKFFRNDGPVRMLELHVPAECRCVSLIGQVELRS